jgi:hypothetical protein
MVTRFFGDVNYALDTLNRKSIAFVHNKLMNDPFDPYFYVETEFKNRREFLKWVSQNHPSKLRMIRQNVPYEGYSAGFKRVRNDFDRRRGNTYLYSTSAEVQDMHPKDNLYLWGHYGLGHRGVALEFNAANLARDVLAHGDPDGMLALAISDLWVKVDYKTQVTPLSYETYFDFIVSGPPADNEQASPGLKGIKSFLEQTLKTKHTVWRMENEWRLLWLNDSGENVYHCPISEDSIAGIYLGLRINAAIKEDLLSTVKSRMPGVPVAQAVKAQGNFALEWDWIARP